MTRLPTPGGDDNHWGTLLNDFLSVEHNSDGTLKVAGSIQNKVETSGGGKEKVNTLTSAGPSPVIDLTLGNVHLVTLTATNATVSVTGATFGVACSASLYIKQDVVGGRVITWPASIKWPGGIAPTLSSGANKIDLVVLETVDGGTTWFGALAGADYR
jgi:hypothetical protein